MDMAVRFHAEQHPGMAEEPAFIQWTPPHIRNDSGGGVRIETPMDGVDNRVIGSPIN
jgi:hypothetical protein